MTSTTDTPRTDAFYPSDADFWGEKARLYCSSSQYWRERAEKAEAEVERLKASVQHYQDQALRFQHAWEQVQAMYNKLIYTSIGPVFGKLLVPVTLLKGDNNRSH